MYRTVLGCGKHASAAFVHHELGVVPFELRLHALRARFFGRLVLNSMHQPGSILRSVFDARWHGVVGLSLAARVRHRSACSLLVSSLAALGLAADFQRLLVLDASPGTPAYAEAHQRWSQSVEHALRAHTLRSMSADMAGNRLLKDDLFHQLGGEATLTRHIFLWRSADYVRDCPRRALVSTRAILRSGAHGLRLHTGRFETDPPVPRAERTCLLCRSPAVETVEHFLCDCTEPTVTRCRNEMLETAVLPQLATVLQCHPEVAKAHWADLPRTSQAWLLLGVLPVAWAPFLREQLADGHAPSIPDSQLARFLSHRTLVPECHRALRALDAACLHGVHQMVLARKAADPAQAAYLARQRANRRTMRPSTVSRRAPASASAPARGGSASIADAMAAYVAASAPPGPHSFQL
jgi:hypothetical protein